MLNCFTPAQLSQLVAAEDEKGLTAVPGIGAKSARRILLDLKDKLQFMPAATTPKTQTASSPSVLTMLWQPCSHLDITPRKLYLSLLKFWPENQTWMLPHSSEKC